MSNVEIGYPPGIDLPPSDFRLQIAYRHTLCPI
jgi:hypothetical protein